MHAGVGALYCASEPYALRCDIKLRSFWAELPRQAFARRFDSEAPPLIARFSRGLGRCGGVLRGAGPRGADLDPQTRAKLSEQFTDIIALAISADPGRHSEAEISVRSARLRSVNSYIDEHLSDPRLSLSKIAEKTGFRCAIFISCFAQSTCLFPNGCGCDDCNAATICSHFDGGEHALDRSAPPPPTSVTRGRARVTASRGPGRCGSESPR